RSHVRRPGAHQLRPAAGRAPTPSGNRGRTNYAGRTAVDCADRKSARRGVDVELVNPVVREWQRAALDEPGAVSARGAEGRPWFRRWGRVLAWTPPTFRWFVGGQTNLAYSCLDHHVARGWGGHCALIAEDERGGRSVQSYAQLLETVKELAAALRGLGV